MDVCLSRTSPRGVSDMKKQTCLARFSRLNFNSPQWQGQTDPKKNVEIFTSSLTSSKIFQLMCLLRFLLKPANTVPASFSLINTLISFRFRSGRQFLATWGHSFRFVSDI